jgi:uncharacterized protein
MRSDSANSQRGVGHAEACGGAFHRSRRPTVQRTHIALGGDLPPPLAGECSHRAISACRCGEDSPGLLPDRVPIGTNMTTSRTCGACSLCCKLLPIAVLDKQANLWCRHCKPGNGCSIYRTRPQVCRDYQCGWLLGVLNDHWSPANCHMIVTLPYEGHPACMVAVDPDHANTWEQAPYLEDLKKMAAQYGFVQVVLATAEGPMIGLVSPFRVIKLPLDGFVDDTSF